MILIFRIKDRLDVLYGDPSPWMATIKNWFNEFDRGLTTVFDEPRPVAPKTSATKDNIKKIHDLVLLDRRLKVCKVAEKEEMVHHILCGQPGVRKLSARREENKRNRETTSADVCRHNRRQNIDWYTLKTKEQSK